MNGKDLAPSHDEDDLPLVLVTGMPRSGKTSIIRVVFSHTSPHDTLMLHSDSDVIRTKISSLVPFRIWDIPGNATIGDDLLEMTKGLVYVIDAQDDYVDALVRLQDILRRGAKVNPGLEVDVFVHKVDGLSEDYRDEIQRDVTQRVQDFMEDYGLEDFVRITFHMTSIYELSIYEACSKVVQRLIPQGEVLENLMNALVMNSGMDKGFLFDVEKKVFLASDSNPFHGSVYEMGVDLVDLVQDMCYLYDNDGAGIEGDAHANPASGRETKAIIKFNNGFSLYYRELNSLLGLVCLMRTENFDKHGLLDYNVNLFRDAILAIAESHSMQSKY